MLKNIYQVVKNKFSSENSAEELLETNNSPNTVKSAKPDHTIVDIEEDFHQQSIDSSPALTSSPVREILENQTNNSSIIEKKPNPTHHVSNSEARIPEELIMQSVFSGMEDNPQPNQSRTISMDVPKVLTFKEFAGVIGIQTKLEDQIAKLGAEDVEDWYYRAQEIQDLVNQANKELQDRYTEHYAHYEKSCQRANLPIQLVRGNKDRRLEVDIGKCIRNMKNIIKKYQSTKTTQQASPTSAATENHQTTATTSTRTRNQPSTLTSTPATTKPTAALMSSIPRPIQTSSKSSIVTTPTAARPTQTNITTSKLATPPTSITTTTQHQSPSSSLTAPTTTRNHQPLRAKRTSKVEKERKRQDLLNFTSPSSNRRVLDTALARATPLPDDNQKVNMATAREITKAPEQSTPRSAGSPITNFRFSSPNTKNNVAQLQLQNTLKRDSAILRNQATPNLPNHNLVQNIAKPASLPQDNLLQRQKMLQPKRSMNSTAFNKEVRDMWIDLKSKVNTSNDTYINCLKEYENKFKKNFEEEYQMPNKSGVKPYSTGLKEGVEVYARKNNFFVSRKVTGIDMVKNPTFEGICRSKSNTNKVAEKYKAGKPTHEQEKDRQKKFDEMIAMLTKENTDMEITYQQTRKEAGSRVVKKMKSISKEIDSFDDVPAEEIDPNQDTEPAKDRHPLNAKNESIDATENTMKLEDIKQEIDEMYRSLTSFSSSFYRSQTSVQLLKSAAAEITKDLELSAAMSPKEEQEEEESEEEEEEKVLYREVIEKTTDKLQIPCFDKDNSEQSIFNKSVSIDNDISFIDGSIDNPNEPKSKNSNGKEKKHQSITNEIGMKNKNESLTKFDQLIKNLSKIKIEKSQLTKTTTTSFDAVSKYSLEMPVNIDQQKTIDVSETQNEVHAQCEESNLIANEETTKQEIKEENIREKVKVDLDLDLDPSNWPQLGDDFNQKTSDYRRASYDQQIWSKFNDSIEQINSQEIDEPVKLEQPIRLDQPASLDQLSKADKSLKFKPHDSLKTNKHESSVKTTNEITEHVDFDDPTQWPQLTSEQKQSPVVTKRKPTTTTTPEKRNQQQSFLEAARSTYTSRPPLAESPKRQNININNNLQGSRRLSAETYRRGSLEIADSERSSKTPPTTPRKDGPMVLYLTTKTNETSPKKDPKESPSKSSSKKSTTKPEKEKQPAKKDPTLYDVLATLPDMRGPNYEQNVAMIQSMFQQSQPQASSATVMQFKSCFQKGSITNNSSKSLKNLTPNEKVINCTIELRRGLTNQTVPQSTNFPKSERAGMLNILKKSCKSINDRFKGNLCPLTFNDEFLQDLLKRGIIKQKEQLVETSTSASFKSVCSRAVILLNYIEHVRVIISSKRGDLKRMFSEAQFMLSSIEEFLTTKNHSFLRDEKLGFVSPTILGNAFNCFAEVTFECLEDTFVKDFLLKYGFKVGFVTFNKKMASNVYRIDNLRQFNQSEVEILKTLKNLLDVLQKIDQRFLEAQPFNDLLKLPAI